MQKKTQYRVKNWSYYNDSLVKRGDVTIWFDEESISKWHNRENPKKKGRPLFYSAMAIQCPLTIRAIFKLPLRATEGFLRSLIRSLCLEIKCPDYTTLCKRQNGLQISLPRHVASSKPIHLVIDSTGLKVYGEGEWKVRQHGHNKRRTWRKLHLAIDSSSHLILSAALTTNDFKDSELLPDLISSVKDKDKIFKISADSGYDSFNCYDEIKKIGAEPLIPPRQDAVVSNGKDSLKCGRDDVVNDINMIGIKQWKIESNYYKRSLSETGMYRYKTIFGQNLSSRKFENQCTESFIKCATLNKITNLGMCQSYRM